MSTVNPQFHFDCADAIRVGDSVNGFCDIFAGHLLFRLLRLCIMKSQCPSALLGRKRAVIGTVKIYQCKTY